MSKEEKLAYKKRYRELNKEKIKAYKKEYAQRDYVKARKRIREPHYKAYKRLYGITEQDFQRMFTEQNGVCKICLREETASRNGKVKRLSVDHCHTTGKVRGLLCQRCNTALARYKDDIETFKRFVAYLE